MQPEVKRSDTAPLPGAFQGALAARLPAQNIIRDLAHRLALSGDASFYRLIPKLVVRIDDIDQLSQLLRLAGDHSVAVTFRAAGTSLCGQAVTDSVLVLLSEHWRGAEVLEQGTKIRLQPGVIGAQANRMLQPWGRKIGPDPASIDSCKIGGIAANNASGMCCGVKQNSYHTLADMTLVLADGTVLDTADLQSVQAFSKSHRPLLDGLSVLHQQVQQDNALAEKIRHKYRLKNTTGYGINALLDFDQPLEILKHLLIGSEGTLGFMADITYHTVADEAFKASGLFIFAQIGRCCELVTRLADAPVAAVELMDARALRSVADKPAMPEGIAMLDDEGAALLIEVRGHSQPALEQALEQVRDCLAPYTGALKAQVDFSQNQSLNQALWAIRKGMFPAVGAVRAAGTTVIIEDVAFPVARLAEGVEGLHRLFKVYGYDEAIIFGHALEGNLHFVFTQAFDTEAQIQRYQDFMQSLSELVTADFAGSLKAEHGTGRNMAPFVRMEWGDQAYALMEQIKRLFDPDGILNPGVILNPDPKAHVRHLKPIPALNPELDKCIECGFCEPVCPSKDLTLTPRQRIALWRQMQSADYTPQQQQELTQAYQYLGIDSCAATGLCAQRCPVGINTGDFINTLRARHPKGKWLAGQTAQHFASTALLARFALNSVQLSRNLLGDSNTGSLLKGLNKVSGGAIPRWYPAWPSGAHRVNVAEAGHHHSAAVVVYFPTCSNRIFAADNKAEDRRPLAEVIASVLHKAGFRLLIPDNTQQLCCGSPWVSKGHTAEAQFKADQSIAALMDQAKADNLPVLVDASPCALRLKQQGSELQLYETAEFLNQFVLPKLNITRQQEPVSLHITCSSRRLQSEQHLLALTRACAEQVIVPQDIYCCGFAGDKGFYTPQLNASALTTLSQQIPADCRQGISNSRSCEIGLQQHSGIPYQSVAYLLDKVSAARGNS